MTAPMANLELAQVERDEHGQLVYRAGIVTAYEPDEYEDPFEPEDLRFARGVFAGIVIGLLMWVGIWIAWGLS